MSLQTARRRRPESVLQAERRHAAAEGSAKSLHARRQEVTAQLAQHEKKLVVGAPVTSATLPFSDCRAATAWHSAC